MWIELNQIIPARQAHIYDEREVAAQDDEDGEDDGIVQFRQVTEQAEPTTPTVINSDHVKSFYRRKKRQDGTQPTGTRINFSNGSGLVVTETYDTVKAKLGL